MRANSGRVRAAAGILLCIAAVAVSALREAPAEPPGSARSNAPDGRRAARLFLRELGWRTEVFDDEPARLPRARVLLFVPSVPRRSRGEPESGELDPGERALLAGPHSPAYYRRFVAEGGVLAAPAQRDVVRWLWRDLELSSLAVLARSEVASEPDTRDQESLWIGDEAIEAAPRATPDLSVLAQAEPLVTDEAGRVWAARLSVGRGSVVLLPAGGLFENEALDEHDHALLLERLCERVAPSERVLFDDYAAGAWSARGPVSRALESDLDLFTWHVLVLALLGLWTALAPSVFPRGERVDHRLRAIARAEAESSLLVRARCFAPLARELRSDAMARLERQLGAAPGPPEERARALARRRGADPEAWVEVLCTRPVPDAGALEILGRELESLVSPG